jgi:pimeloyl-ACP methyl ester carboxylesterase
MRYECSREDRELQRAGNLPSASFLSGNGQENSMVGQSTRHYVLIAGAFHGGWVWREVAEGLRAAGHTVSTPTLTGLGERRHLGQGADLDMHVEDVVAHIEMEGLPEVTLVGWSYGGMVITGVLARIPTWISAVIYLDAFVPEDGKALIEYLPPEMRAAIDAHRGTGLLPPFAPERLGLTDPAQIAFITPRLVPQPLETFYQPVKAPKLRRAIPTAFIACARNPVPHIRAQLEEIRKDPAIRVDTIDSGHSPMVTEPAETTRLLIKYGS